jgi:hypothetical protein
MIVAGLSACGLTIKSDHPDRLRTRASFDFQCDQSKLVVTVLDDNSRGVEGCGKRAVYIKQYTNSFGDYTWVLNTDSTRPNAAPPNNSPMTPSLMAPPPAPPPPPPAGI